MEDEGSIIMVNSIQYRIKEVDDDFQVELASKRMEILIFFGATF